MGAATFTASARADGRSAIRYTDDGLRAVEGTLTPSTSYATGGETFAIATQGAGLTTVERLEIIGDAANNSGLSITLLGTITAPLFKYWETANTEVANATNITARTARVRLIGR